MSQMSHRPKPTVAPTVWETIRNPSPPAPLPTLHDGKGEVVFEILPHIGGLLSICVWLFFSASTPPASCFLRSHFSSLGFYPLKVSPQRRISRFQPHRFTSPTARRRVGLAKLRIRKTERARVHGRDEHEGAGQRDFTGAAGDGDGGVL